MREMRKTWRPTALLRCAVSSLLALAGVAAQAALGMSQVRPIAGDGPVSVYYPTAADERALTRGHLSLMAADEAVPQRGNGRLVVISHGSGGAPWVHADLARTLVQAGFVVALPEHRGDNYKDDSNPGPDSWKQRPAEVSRAIDAVAADARFAPLLQFDRVGVYGMSAGGHTALTMAGGRWSSQGFKQHCDDNLEQDFYACVGLALRLSGGPFDGIKKWAAHTVIDLRFTDATQQQYSDPRVAAVVAAVPFAADYDMASLVAPRVPLGLVTAQQDRWLVPRFHSDRVLAACRACEHIADLPSGGHGAMLSPLPPGFTGLAGELLNDPPGFDRGVLPEVDRRIAAFFVRHLQ